MLTGDNGTLTIQDIKLVSLAYKTLCDLPVHVSKLGTWILGKLIYYKDCIISTRKMVTCPKLHKFCHRATGRQNELQRIKWSISTPNQHLLSLNILRQKHGDKKFCSGCSHGNRLTNANSPKLNSRLFSEDCERRLSFSKVQIHECRGKNTERSSLHNFNFSNRVADFRNRNRSVVIY